MLIALFTILFLGGSSTGLLDYIGEMEDSVKSVMIKDERRKAALSIVSDMEKRTEARNKRVDNLRNELMKTLADPDGTVEDLNATWDVYFEEITAHGEKMIDLRFELRDKLTREEWEQAFSD